MVEKRSVLDSAGFPVRSDGSLGKAGKEKEIKPTAHNGANLTPINMYRQLLCTTKLSESIRDW